MFYIPNLGSSNMAIEQNLCGGFPEDQPVLTTMIYSINYDLLLNNH